jgi:hypothetical protein
VTVNSTLAPEGALGDDAHAPVPYPRNAIEQAIDDAIANTPTPSGLPGCGSPEIVEGFLCRLRLGLGFPDLVVDG